MCAVVEPQPLVVPACGHQGGQHVVCDPRPAGVGRDRHRVRLQGVQPVPQPGREYLFELGERAQRGLFDAGDRAARAGSQADRDSDGFLVVQQQRRERGSGAESVAAGRAAGGVYGVAEFAQAVHVVADRARCDVEPFGEFGAGPLARCLQEGQQFEQSGGGLQHFSILAHH